jgi:hypothetical protein
MEPPGLLSAAAPAPPTGIAVFAGIFALGALFAPAVRSGLPKRRYNVTAPASITVAAATNGHETDGSGPSRGILRSHGNSTINAASVLQAPAKNQNSAKSNSLSDAKSAGRPVPT